MYSPCVSRMLSVALLALCVATSSDAALQIAADGYLYAEHHADLVGIADGITVEGWFHLEEHPAEHDVMPLFTKPGSYGVDLRGRPGFPALGDVPPYVQLVAITYPPGDMLDGHVHCGLLAGHARREIPDPNPFVTGVWVHVALSLQPPPNPNWALYLDGVLMSSPDVPEVDVGEWNSRFMVGGMGAAEAARWPCLPKENLDTWAGSIDTMRVSRGIRYRGAVLFAPERELRVDRTTVALWRFGGPAATYEDESGNGHTLFSAGTLPVSPAGKLGTTWAGLKAN